jgi:hypothetical protein
MEKDVRERWENILCYLAGIEIKSKNKVDSNDMPDVCRNTTGNTVS